MKKHNHLLVLAVILAAFGFASRLLAADPTVTETLVRIQAEVVSGDVTAFFEKSVVINGTTYKQPWESVGWNSSVTTVTVNGTTMTYGQVMQFVAAIANQERAAKLANPVAALPPIKLTANSVVLLAVK